MLKDEGLEVLGVGAIEWTRLLEFGLGQGSVIFDELFNSLGEYGSFTFDGVHHRIFVGGVAWSFIVHRIEVN